jgi:putative DNA primase/helicase
MSSNNSKTSLNNPDEVVLINASDIEPVAIDWLWQGWLAIGKLHILAGMPGQGKTSLALSIAAIVSSGSSWPDGSKGNAGIVLIWSGEDDIKDTLLPRLMACGANRSNCYFIDGRRDGGIKLPFDPTTDLRALQEKALEIGNVKLIIIDPIVSVIAGDSHKNSEVRRGLQPIVDLANSLGAAVLGISHFSKGGAGSDPASRVVGSIAFAAVARVVLVAAKVISALGEVTHIFARSKSNIGPDDGGFSYEIEQVEVEPGIVASQVVWGEKVHGSALDLISAPQTQNSAEKTNKKSEAVELLRTLLVSDCWTPASTCQETMILAGFSEKQIWTASKKLDIDRKKSALKEGWYWRLKADFLDSKPKDSKGSNV